MKKTLVKSFAMAAIGSLAMAASALALPNPNLSIQFIASDANFSISDGGVGDLNVSDNVVTYSGSVGANWSLNVSTGVSPFGSVLPSMDLNSINGSVDAGSLQIIMKDYVTWSPNISGYKSLVGGTSDGTVSFESFVDSVSQTFQGVFGPGAYADTSSASILPASGSGWIELVATITHGGSGLTSFDWQIKPVPEPATMLLLGTGLAGIAGLRRRKAKK